MSDYIIESTIYGRNLLNILSIGYNIIIIKFLWWCFDKYSQVDTVKEEIIYLLDER